MPETRRWINQSQPQTLQIAVFLLYINAVFAFLGLRLLLVAGYGLGGYGIANERKWGYTVAVITAAIPLLIAASWIFTGGDGLFGNLLSTGIIGLMFDIALMALLLHPQSREYQRVWFS
jgi:hypothetical protein